MNIIQFTGETCDHATAPERAQRYVQAHEVLNDSPAPALGSREMRMKSLDAVGDIVSDLLEHLVDLGYEPQEIFEKIAQEYNTSAYRPITITVTDEK